MPSPPLVFYLHAAAPLAPEDASSPPTDRPTEVNGQPVAYFWADAIRAGRYVHPLGRFELNVDRRRLDTWADNFRRMREAGVDVPVPVDHSNRARDNQGYVDDVRRDGDRLLLLHQLIGDDAIRLAARNKVSLAIDPAFRTGTGELLGDCIVHSALTPIPVVPGQGGLTPLSRDGEANDAEPADASPPLPPPPPQIVFHLAMDDDGDERTRDRHVSLIARRIDHLVTGGHITPACRDRLMLLFRSRDRPPEHASPLHLSRDGNFDALDALLGAFEHNRALIFAERTGLQTLARPIPDDPSALDPALQTRMVRMASGR